MPYIVMQSPRDGLKTYASVVEAGGQEVPNAIEFAFYGEAKQIAEAYSRDEADVVFLVIPVLNDTLRVKQNV